MTAFVWNVDHEVSREIRSAFGSLDDVFSMQGEVVTRSPISALVKVDVAGKCYYVESAHKVVKKVKTPSRSQPTRKLGSSCTNLTI